MCVRSIVVHTVFNVFTACSVATTKANFHIVDRKVFVFMCLEDQMLAGDVGKRTICKNWTDATSWVQGGTKKRQAAFSGSVSVRSAW